MHGMLQQHPLHYAMHIIGRRQVLSKLISGPTAARKKELLLLPVNRRSTYQIHHPHHNALGPLGQLGH